jgi:hypothetical protein
VIRRLAVVVTAFTLGHSVTLALGALGLLRLPSAPVELAVAGSILCAAIHALRPVFPGREAWIAGAFGLLHGLAFAGALEGLGFDRAGLLTLLSGFNLGVEVVQLGVVLAVAPALVVIVRGPLGGSLRVAGATFAAAATIGWMGERAFGLPNPMGALVEAARLHGAAILGGLYAVAAATYLRRRVRPSAPPTEALHSLGGPP